MYIYILDHTKENVLERIYPTITSNVFKYLCYDFSKDIPDPVHEVYFPLRQSKSRRLILKQYLLIYWVLKFPSSLCPNLGSKPT